jgi:hypothetical protein
MKVKTAVCSSRIRAQTVRICVRPGERGGLGMSWLSAGWMPRHSPAQLARLLAAASQPGSRGSGSGHLCKRRRQQQLPGWQV